MSALLKLPLLVGLCLGTLLCSRAEAILLSPSDRVRVTIVDAEELSGDYVVRGDGTISLNQFGPVPAAGGDEMALSGRITEVVRHYLKYPVVSVRLQAAGPINVIVTGAVYRPGPVLLGAINAAPQAVAVGMVPAGAPVVGAAGMPVAAAAQPGAPDGQGDAAPVRTLSTAIKAAGGIQPNADLERVVLTRDGQTRVLNLRPAIEQSLDYFGGQGSIINEPLVAGDRIHIPKGQVLNASLHRSQLAPDQIQVSVSGKEIPKAGQLALLPGSRLVDALTAAGATGGGFLGSGRTITLSRIDPATGKAIQSSVGLDEAVRGESPYLLQGDAIFVSESAGANFLDIIGKIAPFGFFLNFFK